MSVLTMLQRMGLADFQYLQFDSLRSHRTIEQRQVPIVVG